MSADAIRRISAAHPLARASQRPYEWAFIGNTHSPTALVRSDRDVMLDVFSKWQPALVHRTNRRGPSGPYLSTLTPRAVSAGYAQAKFAPVGMGQHCHDSFRIYEAARLGAIPIVVGPAADLAVEFGGLVGGGAAAAGGNVPESWIVAESWSLALAQARNLSRHPRALNARQRAVVAWWYATMDETRKLLSDEVRFVVDAPQC